MSSFIPKGSRAGRLRFTPNRRAAWAWTTDSSRRSSSARTRSTSKAATLRPTLTATRDQRLVALGSALAARGLSRVQSRDGLAVRSRPRHAREKPPGGVELAPADRDRTRSLDRDGRGCRLPNRGVRAAIFRAPARGAGPHNLRFV